MITEQTPLATLYGVGPKIAQKLKTLDLLTVDDLLHYYPRRYEDFSNPRLIDQVVPDEPVIVKARIIHIENSVSPKKRLKLTQAVVADDSGRITITWFNQPFLIRTLREGTTWIFSGKAERDYKGNMTLVSPTIEREPKIIPVYGETVGLTSKVIRKLLYELLHYIDTLEDYVPDPIREQQQLIPLGTAFRYMHFPETIEQISIAKKRLAFDELFLLLLGIQASRKELQRNTAPACKPHVDDIKQFIASLPYTLTPSQKKASWEIIQDIEKYQPMNRLLEGDVGSGKTVVGAIAALVVAKNDYRTVWMAPTELLANQHYETCQSFLEAFGVRTCLLTGSTGGTIRDTVNTFDLIIGTQAVIQDKVTFDRLGLIIVDEQHRFGVKQRNILIAPHPSPLLPRRGDVDTPSPFRGEGRGEGRTLTPHFLAMTATPIPRTLALTVYGDLDISTLQTVPTGRLPIISRFVDPLHRKEAYSFIRSQIREGRQAFVVCPLVHAQASKAGQLDLGFEEKKAAVAEYEKLSRSIFPDLRVGLLHGKLKPKEKEETMDRFKRGEIDLLVSTAVIEVGIDIPNATVMMIEGADRFGLAQLHQFRGRVGRAEHQSYCFVFTDTNNPAVFERLKAFTQTTSGFDLAELDLELRGPGQLQGIDQSGFSGLKLASISDIALIQRVKSAVTKIMSIGLSQYPLLASKVSDERGTLA